MMDKNGSRLAKIKNGPVLARYMVRQVLDALKAIMIVVVYLA
jgi:hypothetical protein